MTAPKTREAPRPQALYARILRLKHINPSGLLCFLFFEGSVALAVVLAFAELVNWLAVAVLPLSIAVMVKVNDVIAGIPVRGAQRAGGGQGAVEAPTRQQAARAQDIFAGQSAAGFHGESEPVGGWSVEPDTDDSRTGESPWLSRQRVRPAHNDATEAIDAAQRARQSAAYRYE